MYDAVFIISGTSCNKTKIGGWGFSVYDIKGVEGYKPPLEATAYTKLMDNYYLSCFGVNRKWEEADSNDQEIFKVLRVRDLTECFGAVPEPSTLSKAESYSFLEAIKLIDEKHWENVLIYCDSRAVAERVGKLIKSSETVITKRKDGSNITNYDVWNDITALVLKLITKKVNLKWQWITDTLTKEQGEYAKLLAKKGQALGFNGKERGEECFLEGKKKIPENRCHGFLLQSRMYFIPSDINVTPDGKRYYFCGNHGKKDEWCGKPRSDSTVSVFILKELDLVMELLMGIKRKDEKVNYKGQVIKLDNVRTAGVRNEIITHHTDLMILDNETGNIENYAGKTFILEQSPPYLFFRLFDKMTDLYLRLNDYDSGVVDENSFYIDITDRIYTTTPRGSKIVNKHFNTSPSVTIPIEKINKEVTLTIGMELLSTMALGRISPENPIVRLYLERVSPFLYKYWVYIKTDKAVGLFSTTDANSIFLTELEEIKN